MLAGETAVVTGAGRNVGQGIAETLAEHGASVTVADIDEGRATDVAESLPTDDGQNHQVSVTDVTDPTAVRTLAERVRGEYDGLDILVNNVGYAENKGVFDVSVDEWERVIDLNLRSAFLCTKFLGEFMAETGGGRIVNLASSLGHRGATDKVAYCAAKGGILSMTRQLALDLAEFDIRVNSISPGLVGDPVGHDSGREERDPDRIPLRRIGEPDDIGDAVLYLTTDLSGYVTGTDVRVDGGLTI